MKRIAILMISLLCLQALQAQDRLDILTVSGRLTAPQDYEGNLYQGSAKESGGFMGLTLPIPISEKSIIYNSLNYFYFHVNSDAAIPDTLIGGINLHGFILRTGLIQNLGNGQSLQLLIAPRWMTDGKGGGFDNFQFGGLAVYQKVFNSHFTLGFGAMYNQEFFGPYLVPVVNLSWKATEKFSIAGLLPVYAKIKYQATDKFSFGLSHFGLTTSFNLNDEKYADDYLERQSIDLALFGNYQLGKNLFAEVRVGQSLNRCYRQYGQNQTVDFAIPLATFGDNRIVKNAEFEDGLFGELRLIYSIEIP